MSMTTLPALRPGEDALAPYAYGGGGFERPATPGPTPGAKLREIGRMLLRRKRAIILCLFGLNGLAFLVINHLQPSYTAEASVIIGQRQEQVVDLKAVISGLGGESDVIESEVQLLRSRRIASGVVEQLNLVENVEFNPALKGPGLVRRWRDAIDDATAPLRHRLGSLLGLSHALTPAELPAGPLGDAQPVDPLAAPTDAFLRHLSVTPKGRSRVITVSFDSASPRLSEQAANAVADAYIDDQLKSKLDATEHAHRWLSDRVAELREQVINADQEVETYRRKIGATQGRVAPLLAEQISALSEKLVQAQVDEAMASSRLQAAGAVGALPEVQASAVVQGLRAQQSAMIAEEVQLARNFGAEYPKLKALRGSIAELSGRIRAESGTVATSLRANAQAAADRVVLLNAQLAQLRVKDNTGSQGEVELHMLQHEADADRALYDRLLARAKETNVESGLQQADAQVISHAEAPTMPSFPNPALMLPIFFVASLIVTGLVVLALENLDQGFSHLDQVEETLGVAALGVVPFQKRRGLRGRVGARLGAGLGGRAGQDADPLLLDGRNSVFSEAMRSLHTSLMLSGAERPPKVVLVSSSLPGEGKSSTVLALARLMANCGKRVAVIDCDLRRPRLHAAFGVARTPGLLDCLAGGTPIAEVLQRDKHSPAYLVPAGTPSRISPDLFSSIAMRNLVMGMADQFDLVLLDSGPMLAVSDTRNLCRLADKTVLLVQWQQTRRSAVLSTLRQIVDAGGNLAGVLLSMVDLQRYAQYGDTGFYQRRINLYLTE